MRQKMKQELILLVNEMLDDLRHNPVVERGELRESLEQRTLRMQEILLDDNTNT